MLFNSHLFLLVFLPVVWGAFWTLRRRSRAVEWLLLGASFVFYAWGAPWLAALIGASILVNYTIGRRLGSSGGSRLALLVAGITANLLLLGYFKYANFLLDNLNAVAGTAFAPLAVALPLGISFFTFQQVAYLVDVATSGESERSLRRYALFVSYFPQLVAGPIVHHRQFLPQVAARTYAGVTAKDIGVGLTLVAIGLAKKVLCADSVAPMADAVFQQAGDGLGAIDAWIGTLAFTLQIYFDFSGYADIAVGLGRLFGFRLPVNFASPYQATSIIDFWRRWHITLSEFLKSYVYIPLGGSRKGFPRQIINLLAVMLVGGLWHGANWTFVAWGGAHGVALACNHIWRRRFAGVGRWPGALVGRTATFVFVACAWVLFRAGTFAEAWDVWRAMAGLTVDTTGPVAFTLADSVALGAFNAGRMFPVAPTQLLLLLGGLLAIVWGLPNATWLAGWVERRLDEPRATLLPVAAAVGLLLALATLSMAAPREFIYFRF
ncbi:MAG: MBOAT family protein [Vicinamibacterales bacterium]